MFDRLQTAKSMYDISILTRDKIEQKAIKKCLRVYFLNCVILRKKEFTIIFKGKHLSSPKERFLDYVTFFKDKVYSLYLKTFTPHDDRTLYKYSLIHGDVLPPVHVKLTNAPYEKSFEKFLRLHGLKIKYEKLGTVETKYLIAINN